MLNFLWPEHKTNCQFILNEGCTAIENEVDDLIAVHEGDYGEAKIYKDLGKIIKSNIIQLQIFFR